jgi:hypothetical protein
LFGKTGDRLAGIEKIASGAQGQHGRGLGPDGCLATVAPRSSCTDRHNAKVFWASIAEYPDPLQDALFVIAHARGFEAAIAALDQAIRGHLADLRRNFPAAPLWNGERTHTTERDAGLRRAAS